MEDSKAARILTEGSALASAAPADVKRDYQAYEILHWGFVLLPIFAGADKFAHVLCDWTMYLSSPFAVFGPQTTMHVVGAIEIVAGLGVAIKPRLFAPIVTLWLWGIIANLLVLGGFFDVALRDFVLSLAALGLWRLSQHFDTTESKKTTID